MVQHCIIEAHFAYRARQVQGGNSVVRVGGEQTSGDSVYSLSGDSSHECPVGPMNHQFGHHLCDGRTAGRADILLPKLDHLDYANPTNNKDK